MGDLLWEYAAEQGLSTVVGSLALGNLRSVWFTSTGVSSPRLVVTSKNAVFRCADDALADPWSRIGLEGRSEALHVFERGENRR